MSGFGYDSAVIGCFFKLILIMLKILYIWKIWNLF